MTRRLGCFAVALGAFPAALYASEPEIQEIVVRADPLRLIELDDSRTAFGLNLSYDETPRAISVVSDETIRRFGVDTVDDLSSLSPGTFTGSFFGVPGSVNLRGNRADTYFRGFKRVENPGSFPTPIAASERIEIVRGPTPSIYGAGRVGGFINIIPTTARTERALEGQGRFAELGVTSGSYGKAVGIADLGAAFPFAGGDAGAFLHVEHEDSKSYYRGIEPRRTHVQAAVTFARGDDFTFEAGGLFFDADGYRQTIGWNRVTQALIDDGVYITGRDTDLRDLNGDGKLTPGEVDAAVGSFFGTSNIRQFIDFGLFPGAAFSLDTGLGTARLDPRTVFLSDRDIGAASTGAAYADAAWRLGARSTLRLQAFYDSMNAKLYQSYGFAANYVADVYELRASYETRGRVMGVDLDAIAGLSYRAYDNKTLQTFLSGYLVVDRRDLTRGATGDDMFDDPFSVEPGGVQWDTALDSLTTDLGAFATIHAERGPLSFMLGARLDRFTAASINRGATVFNPALSNTRSKGADIRPSVETSLRYAFSETLSAYATYARNNALETNDGGGIEVDRIAQKNFVADSRLIEAGMKLGGKSAAGSLAFYRQERQRQDPFGNLDREISKGVEAELRALLTDTLSLNGAATLQQTRVAAPGPCGSGNGEFVVLPPGRAGLAPAAGYGGLLAALNASCLAELSEGYLRRTTPAVTGSAFLTYTSRESAWGSAGASFGLNYVGETGGKIANAIRLPSYVLGKAAIFYAKGGFAANISADNLFDRRYFIPVQNVYEEVGVLPGRGREIFFTLTARL
jgi:iron complex outermembrane receptor protein